MTKTTRDAPTVRMRYVLTVVVDPQSLQAIGMVKLKGPAHVVGRISFPGGRLEAGESLEQAATREMIEETGVHVPISDWKRVSCVESATAELNVLAAVSTSVLEAVQLELEPVRVLNLLEELERARLVPEAYAPDFLLIVRSSLKALSLPS